MIDKNHNLELSKEQIDSVVALYSNRQYQEAIDQIIALDEVCPNVPFLFNLIGACYKAIGQLEVSVKMFEKAVSIKPDFAEAYKNLGITLKELGQLDEAIESFKQSINLEPNNVILHYHLAITFKGLDKLDFAVESYKKAISIKPDFFEAHNNLGNVLKDLKLLDPAVESYKKAISIKPDFFEAYYNLGVAHKVRGKYEDAVKYFKKVLKNNPDFAEAHNNLGSSLTFLGQMDLAIKSFQNAINIQPNYAEAYKNLGFNLFSNGKIKEAADCFEKAIAIDPNFAEAHRNLGNIFKKLKELDKAMLCYEIAYKINPKMDFILGDILNNKMNLCSWDNIPKLLDETKKKIVDNQRVVGPFSLLGLIDDPALQRLTSEIFANFYYPIDNTLTKLDLYQKHKKIRIGYFSADFKIHPVATLTAELYELHDRNKFEIYAFSFGPDSKDKMNLRIKKGVDHFYDVQKKSHREIVEIARSFEIDIAVDLGGFTAKSRTNIFAMSAAPIQISYIGYLGTMGINYYDYLIADSIMIPKKNQKYFTEKIIYLPNFQVNDSKELPPDVTLTRKDIGLPEESFVFCCFNNTYKLTPTSFDSWTRILKKVDNAVLLLYVNSKKAKNNLMKEIALRSLDSSRVIFGDRLPRAEYLARYKVADLFLDTLPYNAGATASDALRMGLPVLTLKGKSYPARMGASILNALNLNELITSSQEEYESFAIELAQNPEKLKIIKEKLLISISTAPLYNTQLFTKNIESAYTQIYKRHHDELDPDHIYV